MNPAPSVIVFTTFSGLGFGLLAWLGLGFPLVTGWAAFFYFVLAHGLAVGGLLASTYHLGRPERAIRAFTQWKTSWLSREAWMSVAALIVMALYAAGLVFFGAALLPLGWLGALLSLGTVGTTSMIYTQLRTVPRWRHWTTPGLFLLLALSGGALLAGQTLAALPLLAMTGTLQLYAWMVGDGLLRASGTTLATATGLGGIGTVRAFEPPHTGTNFLLREFVHVVGRRHAARLRIIALLCGFGLPIALLLLPVQPLATVLAALSHVAGVLALRWLFFAQAEHVVGLYYGRR